MDAAEDVFRRVRRGGGAAHRIPGLHGAKDGEIGVGVEAIDEALTLVVEIAADVETSADEAAAIFARPGIAGGGVAAFAVGLAGESLVKERGRLVAEHGELACAGQAAMRRLLREVAAAVPVGVVDDGFALQMIE